jgi:ABC transport system ATP-binding/permease protein
MDKVILHLAEQTANFLESLCVELPDNTSTSIVPLYFNRLRTVNDGYSIKTGPAITVHDLYVVINSNLNYTGKVHLLLLVQDCLLHRHALPVFDQQLKHLYAAIGVDDELSARFSRFLVQNDPLSIDQNEYLLFSPQEATDNEMLEGRWIEDNVSFKKENTGKIAMDQFQHHVLVMFVDSAKVYVIRCLDHKGHIFDQDDSEYCNFRLLQPGSELTIMGTPVLTFSDLKTRFLRISEKKELTLNLEAIQYNNAAGIREIHSFSSIEFTGQLIGIVGREGVGKSTLLKLLAGKIKPDSGNIFINGYDLWRYKYLLKGVIGFVPEEDLLFEELSVADNLSLTARLYYSHLSAKEIDNKVNTLLSRLDLMELKHEIVGSINSKHIQPGQRRLINIALEMLREPQILLVDNALSGLGMSDACKVIRILHNYSFNGNLVITSISQADSDTFMLFDKIWILDVGGYPVYNGPVKSAPGYIFKNLGLTYKDEEKTDPAQLLDWISYRLPDKETHVWKRVLEAKDWHAHLIRNQVLQSVSGGARNTMPARILKIPNLEVQLLIFSIRNFKCKFSHINEIFKALLVGPLVGLMVALVLRNGVPGNYTLIDNTNLPVYQFLSVVIALFFGLIASADEIIRERNILEKEEYQEFSRFSYLNSKIMYLFPVIAIQIILYVVTGNLILGIKELLFVYWLVLFSAGCFGILMGLVLSSGVNNLNVLYKVLLPFIIALQLLFGGGIISYDAINIGNHKYTPLIGDLMVSRWGYEALAVEQFKNNRYEQYFYAAEKKQDQVSFYAFYVVPEMEKAMAGIIPADDSLNARISLLKHELKMVTRIPDVFRFEYLGKLSEIGSNENIREEAGDYLTYLGLYFNEQQLSMSSKIKHIEDSLKSVLGTRELLRLKKSYYNLALEEEVTRKSMPNRYVVTGNEIVRKSGMIYQNPDSEWGRACLFSPVKRFNNQFTETLWFNISIIWLLTSLCYIWVLFDITAGIRKVLQINKPQKKLK